MTTVVAFTGKRGSGKSEASKALVDGMNFVDLKFADPLKNMLRAMYKTCGLEEDEIERKIEGDLKEEPCPWLQGKTPRYAMQTLGTEWREMIATDMWSEMFKMRVRSGVFGDKIVCSDYRFPHEGQTLDDLGAVKYRITRDAADAASDEAAQHPSETLIGSVPTDVTIHNDGTLEDLRSNVLNDVHEGMRLANGGDYWEKGSSVSGRIQADVPNESALPKHDPHQARADAERISRGEAKRRNYADSYRGLDPNRDRSLDFKGAAHLAGKQ